MNNSRSTLILSILFASVVIFVAYNLNQFSLRVDVNGQGTVSQNPEQATYFRGSIITMIATPASGWVFAGWGGDLTGNVSQATLTMDGNKAITATFTPIRYRLTITMLGHGLVEEIPHKETYDHGSNVTMIATPASGWVFAGWGGDLTGNVSQATLTMDGNKAITATFTPIRYILTLRITGLGSTIPIDGSLLYNQSSAVQVTATPAVGWLFEYWILDQSEIILTNPYTIKMNEAHSLEAVFTPIASYKTGFIETCDTFDTSIWVYEWNAPTVANGEFVFKFDSPKIIVARTIAKTFGYGTYKIAFRTSGPRIPGVNYGGLFLLNPDPIKYNELDIPELYGGKSSYQMSISTFRDCIVNASGWPEGPFDYRYWNSNINFEDGSIHIFKIIYLEKQIEFYIDDQLSYSWADSSSKPVFANAKNSTMYLYIGVYGSGYSGPNIWTFYVSQIEYTPG